MGMFDTFQWKCPGCGMEHAEQTKDGDCTLATYRPRSVPASIANRFILTTYMCSCGAVFRFRHEPLTGGSVRLRKYLLDADEWDDEGLFGGHRQVFLPDQGWVSLPGPGEDVVIKSTPQDSHSAIRFLEGESERRAAAVAFAEKTISAMRAAAEGAPKP
ncbi:MAG: hypothetical protein V4792_09960 [Pseudomonadota bacterium]